MSGTVFKRFDVADHLGSDEDAAAYLADVAEDGDPAAITLALGAVARARNMSQLARDTGLTREGLHKAFTPGGNPSFSTVIKLAGALGFRIGFLRPPAPNGNMPGRIEARPAGQRDATAQAAAASVTNAAQASSGRATGRTRSTTPKRGDASTAKP